jgi:hypothetical protein
MPALKRIMITDGLPGALKRSFRRINAGASTLFHLDGRVRDDFLAHGFVLFGVIG